MRSAQECILRRLMGGIALVLLAVVTSLAGCEKAREEKILDLKAPGVDVEVNKTQEPGNGGSIKIETHPPDEP